jgi:p-aminobenzoyl-glutamate transporter AbgT
VQGLLPEEQEAKATQAFQEAGKVIGFETKMTDARVSGRTELRVICERIKSMEAKGNKLAIWVLIIIAAIAALVFVPLLKGVMEGISDRAHNDAVFGFGIVTLIALLIFGCVAVIAQNLRR